MWCVIIGCIAVPWMCSIILKCAALPWMCSITLNVYHVCTYACSVAQSSHSLVLHFAAMSFLQDASGVLWDPCAIFCRNIKYDCSRGEIEEALRQFGCDGIYYIWNSGYGGWLVGVGIQLSVDILIYVYIYIYICIYIYIHIYI